MELTGVGLYTLQEAEQLTGRKSSSRFSRPRKTRRQSRHCSTFRFSQSRSLYDTSG